MMKSRRSPGRCLGALMTLLICLSLLPAAAASSSQASSEPTSSAPGETASYQLEGGATADNDALFAQYVDRLFEAEKPIPENGGSILEKLNSALFVGLGLTDNQRAVYNVLKDKLALIAAGKEESTEITVTLEELGIPRYWTAQDLGIEYLYSWSTSSWYPNLLGICHAKLREYFNIYTDVRPVLDALLADCPYELYWYDKTEGMSAGTPGPWWNSSRVEIRGDYTFSFQVASSYAGETPYLIDTTKAKAAQTAVADAESVVDEYKNSSDLEKLIGYREAICDRVSYNDAAADGGVPFGDPWQLIYVFDGDPNTKVVCEGYSKAFQYLCELTEFNSKAIRCYSVTGNMGAYTSKGYSGGAHMWNIVAMDDGENYLVDVTNCDDTEEENEHGIGYPDYLFLKGATENAPSYSYTVPCGGANRVEYTYDMDTRRNYTAEQLRVSTETYTLQTHGDLEGASHTIHKVAAAEASCEEAGWLEHYACDVCGKVFHTPGGRPANGISPETVTIPAVGHSLAETPEVPATCEEPGVHAYWDCASCGKLFSDSEGTREIGEPEAIAPTGHDWDEGVVTTPAGAATEGEMTYTCRHDPSHTRTESIPARPLSIVAQPQSMAVSPGEAAATTVEASGVGLSYQWYTKNSNQTRFYKSSVTSETYTVTASEKMDGRQLYCVIKDESGASVTTDTVTLSVVRPGPVIVTQPVDVTVLAGDLASVPVEAQGNELSYQWYTKNSNQTRFYKSSVTSDTYTVTASEKMDGRQLYCVITDGEGNKVTTDTVTLTVRKPGPVITVQPQDTAVIPGDMAIITVEASGEGLSYQWYTKNSSQTRFYKSSVTTDVYSVTTTEKMNGRQLYCVVKDAEGNSVTTETVTLTVDKNLPPKWK